MISLRTHVHGSARVAGPVRIEHAQGVAEVLVGEIEIRGIRWTGTADGVRAQMPTFRDAAGEPREVVTLPESVHREVEREIAEAARLRAESREAEHHGGLDLLE